jgi:hypothetical protein
MSAEQLYTDEAMELWGAANLAWDYNNTEIEEGDKAAASVITAKLAEKDAEIAFYRQALDDVANPMRVLQRQAEAEGARLSGMAYSVANDLGFVQSIARRALAFIKE